MIALQFLQFNLEFFLNIFKRFESWSKIDTLKMEVEMKKITPLLSSTHLYSLGWIHCFQNKFYDLKIRIQSNNDSL